MNQITSEILEEFKVYMKIGDDEDDNLTRILESSIEDLIFMCGEFDIAKSKRFKSLVFDHARYTYNDAAEYFAKNFQSKINSLGLEAVINYVEGEENEGQ